MRKLELNPEDLHVVSFETSVDPAVGDPMLALIAPMPSAVGPGPCFTNVSQCDIC